MGHPDNAQLNGLVARELARGIQQERFIAAWKNEDFHTIKAFELFYDAVEFILLNYSAVNSSVTTQTSGAHQSNFLCQSSVRFFI
jgi:hypothetical protein